MRATSGFVRIAVNTDHFSGVDGMNSAPASKATACILENGICLPESRDVSG